ncbi:MAG: response regulator, partial [Blastocatellia bacterium]|nr:response regulator [Blastocatellia bacterium]
MTIPTGQLSAIGSDHMIGLFDEIFELYGTIDAVGRVADMRGRIFDRTNTDPDLLVGQILSETVFWQSSQNTSKLLSNAIETAGSGKKVEIILDFRISVDEKIPLDITLLPLARPDEPATIFVCAITHDRSIGDSLHVKRESVQLLAAAENAEIGLWFWDFPEERVYATPQCNELLGLPAYGALSYESFINTVHSDDREFVSNFLAESRRLGTKYEEEFRVIYPGGEVEWICVEGKSFVNSNGEPIKMMGVVRKITEQKLAAEELSKVYDREKKARDEAVEANRAKDFFLAFVSHELRAPLNAILGWSKILLTKEVDEETRRNALETIERSARVQTKLINDLVDSARVASGKLRLEYRPTNLYELVRGSFQAQKPAAEAKGITLEFGSDRADLSVYGDANRLQQVFGNLISNAIKFTPEGGKVAVNIESTDSTASIVVSDTGQGINPDALPSIFRQFSQGDANQTRSSAGLGLGLSIAKILAERHGGSIEAHSPGIGNGSTFTVRLPLANAAVQPLAASVTAPSAEQMPLKGLKILVVEDDADSREVLQLFLEQSGAAVVTATNARSAIRMLTNGSDRLPDAIISDLAMPEEDGYSMMKRIRAMSKESGGQIPALALSA